LGRCQIWLSRSAAISPKVGHVLTCGILIALALFRGSIGRSSVKHSSAGEDDSIDIPIAIGGMGSDPDAPLVAFM